MNTADGKTGFWGIKWLEEFFDKIFGDAVIAVYEANVFTSGELDAMVSGGRLPGVFLMDQFDTGVFCGVFLGDLV